MDRKQGKQLVSRIDALVEECSLLESILVRNSIYFAAFTASEEIHYHNIPGADHLRSLADCEYILEAENLEKIRSLISLSENLGDDEVNITLKNTILEFTLFTLSEFSRLYFLQITLFNQPKMHRQTSDENNLEEFVSPAGALSRLYEVLTPSEIQVAEFIRMGKTSKDIADALDIAQKTVENHRNKVRDKLGLRNRGINLRSYLMQLEGRGSDFSGAVRVRRGKSPS